MVTEVWGTFSVNDHMRQDAFVREVLLFDRLLVPYPNPSLPGERERWRQPNPLQPKETWDPDRLDVLLGILGTKETPGWNGACLAQRAMWDPGLWTTLKTNLEVAGEVTGDPFMNTRLSLFGYAPGLIEAVAAYPSEERWRQEVQPRRTAIPASEALVQLAVPYLRPSPEIEHEEALRQAVELSQDPDTKRRREAYYAWFRDLISPLLSGNVDQPEPLFDASSLRLAEDRLRELWENEQKAISKAHKAKILSNIELACVTVAVPGQLALAAFADQPIVGVTAGLLTFAGWTAAKLGERRPDLPLGGASLFVGAHRQVDWLQQPSTQDA